MPEFEISTCFFGALAGLTTRYIYLESVNYILSCIQVAYQPLFSFTPETEIFPHYLS